MKIKFDRKNKRIKTRFVYVEPFSKDYSDTDWGFMEKSFDIIEGNDFIWENYIDVGEWVADFVAGVVWNIKFVLRNNLRRKIGKIRR